MSASVPLFDWLPIGTTVDTVYPSTWPAGVDKPGKVVGSVAGMILVDYGCGAVTRPIEWLRVVELA